MIKLIHGDCLDRLKDLPDNSVDSIVTDPPYGLSFMGKKWDYDVPSEDVWRECLRVLKPGGHLLAFAGTRTQHRMAVRIEDAGFEIRDMIAWIYGSGFPKSRNIGKDIEKKNVGGIKNLKQIGVKLGIKVETGTQGFSYSKEYVPGKSMGGKQISGEIPVYEINNEWEGWGTALKPALEPITVARKPLIGTVAENVLTHGTGGLNIDGCRVGTEQIEQGRKGRTSAMANGTTLNSFGGQNYIKEDATGRFPANLIHDGSEEVVGLFPSPHGAGRKVDNREASRKGLFGEFGGAGNRHGDSGSAARFFYCAKASKKDRDEGLEGFAVKRTAAMAGNMVDGQRLAGNGTPIATPVRANNHPTVKPTDLMRYLCRLVTPPGGTVLDPFMGSGSTGKAAKLEGFDFIGIEREAEYVEIAKARIWKSF